MPMNPLLLLLASPLLASLLACTAPPTAPDQDPPDIEQAPPSAAETTARWEAPPDGAFGALASAAANDEGAIAYAELQEPDGAGWVLWSAGEVASALDGPAQRQATLDRLRPLLTRSTRACLEVLAEGDGTGMRAVAVPDRTRGWFDLARVDPAYVALAWRLTDEHERGLPRPLLVTRDELVLPAQRGDLSRHAVEKA